MLRNINCLSIFSTVTHHYTLAQCLYSEQAHPRTLFNSLQLKYSLSKFVL